MADELCSVLCELTDIYGIAILDDPERLSQFLEDKVPNHTEEAFRLAFALRFLIKNGWHAKSANSILKKNDIQNIKERLGFSEAQTQKVVKNINTVIEHIFGSNDNNEAIFAFSGSLKKIGGGISNRPHTMLIHNKSVYNGIILILALIVLSLLFFQVCAQRKPVGDELRIAFFARMTGAESQKSQSQLRAAQLAVERINKSNLLNGEYKLKVIGFDLQSDVNAADFIKQTMKDKSFLAMMLGSIHGNVSEIAEAADDVEAPLIIVSEIPPREEEITVGTLPSSYTFSLTSSAQSRAKLLTYFASQALVKKKIAIYYDSSDSLSNEIAKLTSIWAKRFGMTIAAKLSFNGNNHPRHHAAAKAFAESEAELLILPHTGVNSVNVVKDMRSGGFSSIILAEDFDETERAASGKACDNLWIINEVSHLDPTVRSVLKKYRELFNEKCAPQDITSVILSYDGIKWIANALATAPGFHGEAIRHSLLSTKNLVLTHATLTTDPRTHMPLNKAAAVIHCTGGKTIFQRRVRINRK